MDCSWIESRLPLQSIVVDASHEGDPEAEPEIEPWTASWTLTRVPFASFFSQMPIFVGDPPGIPAWPVPSVPSVCGTLFADEWDFNNQVFAALFDVHESGLNFALLDWGSRAEWRLFDTGPQEDSSGVATLFFASFHNGPQGYATCRGMSNKGTILPTSPRVLSEWNVETVHGGSDERNAEQTVTVGPTNWTCRGPSDGPPCGTAPEGMSNIGRTVFLNSKIRVIALGSRDYGGSQIHFFVEYAHASLSSYPEFEGTWPPAIPVDVTAVTNGTRIGFVREWAKQPIGPLVESSNNLGVAPSIDVTPYEGGKYRMYIDVGGVTEPVDITCGNRFLGELSGSGKSEDGKLSVTVTAT